MNIHSGFKSLSSLFKTSVALCTAFAFNASAAPFTDTFDQFNTSTWSCEYSCPTVSGSSAKFNVKKGVAPNNTGSWSKIRYKPKRFTSGTFKVRFNLSHRPEGAVWWGIALWDNGPTSDMKKFNEINFGYTSNQSFTNSQLYFESGKLGVVKPVKIDTGVNLYDGQYHEAALEYDANHVSLYFDGRLLHTITDKNVIPTDPMDFIIGPRLVTGSAPLVKDFVQTVDWTEISDVVVTPPPQGNDNSIVTPVQNGTYTLNQGVPISFAPSSAVSRIVLYYSDAFVDFATLSPPFNYTWYPPTVGNHVLKYETYDSAWNFLGSGSRDIKATSSSNVYFTSPSVNHDIVAGTVHAAVIASDPNAGIRDGAGIQNVFFELLKGTTVVSSRVENEAPYDWYLDTTPFANGAYTLRARSTSTAAAGGDVNTVSIPVTITN
ncbi:MAG: glycoside hydrolase family 16 protein [Cystobacter sp.]